MYFICFTIQQGVKDREAFDIGYCILRFFVVMGDQSWVIIRVISKSKAFFVCCSCSYLSIPLFTIKRLVASDRSESQVQVFICWLVSWRWSARERSWRPPCVVGLVLLWWWDGSVITVHAQVCQLSIGWCIVIVITIQLLVESVSFVRDSCSLQLRHQACAHLQHV